MFLCRYGGEEPSGCRVQSMKLMTVAAKAGGVWTAFGAVKIYDRMSHVLLGHSRVTAISSFLAKFVYIKGELIS